MVSDPAIVYKFDFEDFKNKNPDIKIIKQASSSGDDCHYDIIGMTDSKTVSHVKQLFKPPFLFACCNNVMVEINTVQFEKLHEFKCA